MKKKCESQVDQELSNFCETLYRFITLNEKKSAIFSI